MVGLDGERGERRADLERGGDRYWRPSGSNAPLSLLYVYKAIRKRNNMKEMYIPGPILVPVVIHWSGWRTVVAGEASFTKKVCNGSRSFLKSTLENRSQSSLILTHSVIEAEETELCHWRVHRDVH